MTTPRLIKSYLKFEINYLLDKISFQINKTEQIDKKRTLFFYCGIF